MASLLAAPRSAATAAPAGSAPARKSALVLSGGLALGAYEAGVLRSLHARGMTFDVICGSSMGALNGAMFAQRDLDALEVLWRSVASKPIKKLDPHVQFLVDAYEALARNDVGVLTRAFRVARSMARVKASLAGPGLFGLYDETATKALLGGLNLRRLRTPLAFPVTNADRGESQAIYATPAASEPLALAGPHLPFALLNPTDDDDVRLYPEAIRASAALPVVFPPVRLAGLRRGVTDDDGDRFADGGIANNTPLGLARALGATDIVVIFVGPKVQPARRARSVLDALANMYAANQNQLLDYEMQLTLASCASSDPVRRAVISEIRPASALDVLPLDFDKQDLVDRAYAQGVKDGANPSSPRRVTLPFDV
jgi:predicted acylesterase/phospholipase RssA